MNKILQIFFLIFTSFSVGYSQGVMFDGKWVADPIAEGRFNYITIFENEDIIISSTNNPENKLEAKLSLDSTRLLFTFGDQKAYFYKIDTLDRLFLYVDESDKAIEYKRDGESRVNDFSIFKTLNDNSIPALNIDVKEGTKALLVFPHSDDEVAFSGLVRYLIDKGVSVHYLLLCEHSQARTKEVKCSSKKLGIEKVRIAGLTNNSWENVLRDSIVFWYDNQDSIRSIIKENISEIRPSILVTWDDEIGAYGHPEHRISARLTKELFFDNEFDYLFNDGFLFQFALPMRINTFLFIGSPSYELSRKITGANSLYEPNVSIEITDYWNFKYKSATCHKSQKQVMYNYYLTYNKKEKNEHIKAFNKEYYLMLTK